jgi:tRNA(Ile)-lysidine synthase
MPAFDGERLWQRLQALPPTSGYCVAYSGGRDSHVLLHALASLRPRLSRPIRAIHIDHGLQPDSPSWARHCERVCRQLQIPLGVHEARVAAAAGASIEAAAREARYRIYEAQLSAGEALLLAHHQDDQAETLLLRLLRGAGVQGLTAMAPMRPLGAGLLLRPLIDESCEALAAYARAHALAWVEDPSNEDERFDRNFLRQRLLPELAGRWPGYAATLARTAGHAQEAQALLDELAAQDLAAAGSGGALRVSALAALSHSRRRNLIRYWIRQYGLQPPPAARLNAGLTALIDAGDDRQPQLAWGGCRIRRYRDLLLLDADAAPNVPTTRLSWDLRRPLSLPVGTLTAEPSLGEGMSADLADSPSLSVGFRGGGERCRLAGRIHNQALKKLLQEAGVPPWEREVLPLVYVGEQLAAVGDRWVCEGFQARAGEPGLILRWQRD